MPLIPLNIEVATTNLDNLIMVLLEEIRKKIKNVDNTEDSILNQYHDLFNVFQQSHELNENHFMVVDIKTSIIKIYEYALTRLAIRGLTPSILVSNLVSIDKLIQQAFFKNWLFELTVLEIERYFLSLKQEISPCSSKRFKALTEVSNDIKALLKVESSSYVASFVKNYMEICILAKASRIKSARSFENKCNNIASALNEDGVFSHPPLMQKFSRSLDSPPAYKAFNKK